MVSPGTVAAASNSKTANGRASSNSCRAQCNIQEHACFHKQGSAPVIRPLTRDSKRLRSRLSYSVHADTQSTFHDWPGFHPLFQSLVGGTDFATYLWKSLTNIGHAAVKLNPRPLCAYSNARAENKFHVLQVINAYSVGFYDTLPLELMCTAPRLYNGHPNNGHYS